MNKLIFVLIVPLTFTLMTSVHEIKCVDPSVTIIINADGSIDPPTAPVSTTDNITYTLTADINNESIFVQRNNITIDGKGHVLEGRYVNFSYGISLSNVSNVTVENTRIEAFSYGIFVDSGSNHGICGNNIANTVDAIFLQSSSNDSISRNSITTNSGWGVVFFDSHNETLTRNNITGNHAGVWLAPSSNDEISENNIANNTGDGIALYSVYYNGTFYSSSSNNISRNDITNNGVDGIKLLANSNYNTISANNLIENQLAIEVNYSTHNTIYNNNFMSNIQQVLCTFGFANTWDNGYLSGGNYWSDYNGTDANNDGIGDTPYIIDASDSDNYPLMGMYSSFNVTYFTPALEPHYCNVTVISNSTVSDFAAPRGIEHPEITILTFNVTGEQGTTGFCRVMFPTAMMNGTYHVFVNGTEVPCILLPCSNSDYSYLYFTYTHSTKEVVIIPEFQSFLILPLFMIATLLAVTIYKRKQRMVR